ncbi:DUF4376 domain-containing protein [Pseudomonas sp.]|uniref:DUF4376 domain-containing protein n=1 Tax=Pseudomonas sp. TaxID=306 RepID=UPI003267CB78
MKRFYSMSTGATYLSGIHKVMPGDAVELSEEIFLSVIANPAPGKNRGHDANGLPILIDPPPKNVEQLKEESWEAIKAERERRTFAGFNVAGQWVHSDLFSRSQWLGLKDNARDALAAGGAMGDTLRDTLRDNLSQTIVWKMLDGAFVPVTAQLAYDVVAAVTRSDMDIFTVAEQHNVSMRAAADPASYDHTTGWPQTYAEWAAAQVPV